MERVPVASSNLISVGYDPGSQTLEVEFSSGMIYQYFDVPEAHYHELLGAPSPGNYLAQNIKGTYRYART